MDEIWERITFLIGCGAVVGIVASMIFVISHQVFKPRPVDEDTLTEVTRSDPKKGSWSGKVKSDPALMDMPKAQPREKPVLPAPVTATAEAPSIALGSAFTAPPTSLAKEEPVPTGIEDIDAKRDAISAALEKFFNTPDVEGKAALVRDPQRVKPLMIGYYAREPMPRWKWRGVGKMVRVDEPGYRFGFVQALFEDSTPASLIVEETADGRYLVDWEGLVRYGEVSWGDFLRLKPVEPKLLRVIASKAEDSPSVAALAPPSSQWLELRHPAETGAVLGYFDRNDPKYAKLLEQLELGQWKDVPVTLRLCFPATPTKLEGMGVRIADVTGKGWLILNEPKPQS